MKKTELNSDLQLAETDDALTADSLEAIAAFLSTNTEQLPAGPGLSGGSLGAFLFLHSYSALTDSAEAADAAQAIFRDTLRQLPTYPAQSPLYYREMAEVGLLISYLREQHYLDASFEVVLEKLDQVALRGLPLLIGKSLFDPFVGYLPLAEYLLKRGKRAANGVQGLHQVLDALLHTYEATEQGGFWRSYLFGKNQVYTGWSHGIAAVLLFLSKVVMSGHTYRVAELQTVLRGASHYLLAHQVTTGPNLFPDIVGQPTPSSTLNLCYGDLGIGYALLRTGQALAETPLQALGLSVLTTAALRRGTPECQVHDASLIYGASGNALFFKSLSTATQQPVFEQAATYWRQQMQQLSQHPGCVAGYKSHYNQHVAHTQYSLFEGLPGYGLALLAYEHDALDSLLSLIGY